MASFLDPLQPFDANKSLASQMTVARMNGIMSTIREGQLVPGVGNTLSRVGGGVAVNSRRQRGGGVKPFPFQVLWRPNPDDPSGNTFQAMVNVESDLLQSLRPDDNLTITGLGSWFDFIPNDVIALYIVVDPSSYPYVATSATIQSYGQETTIFDPTKDAWSMDDDSYVFDDGGSPPQQIGINFLIAYSTPDDAGKPFLVQACDTHLVLQMTAIDYVPALFPLPAPYRRYGITTP